MSLVLKYKCAQNKPESNIKTLSKYGKEPNENSYFYKTSSRKEEQNIKDYCISRNIQFNFKHYIYDDLIVAHFVFISKLDFDEILKFTEE